MPFVVAAGYRVQMNRQVFTEGQVVPEEDAALVANGVLIEVSAPVSDQIQSDALDSQPIKVDVNTAELAELIALDGIGEAIAARIIDNRPYDSVEQVRTATGLKAALWAKVEPNLTV